MDPKGNVLIKRFFQHTTNWPGEQFTLSGIIDMEKEYKDALAGKVVQVLDIATDDSGYLVIGESEKIGPFLWTIEKGDTVGFLPIIKKNGMLIPAGMSMMEEVMYMAKQYSQMDYQTQL